MGVTRKVDRRSAFNFFTLLLCVTWLDYLQIITDHRQPGQLRTKTNLGIKRNLKNSCQINDVDRNPRAWQRGIKMIKGFFKRFLFRKRSPIDEARLHTVLIQAKHRREDAQKKIDGMMATLDGCGDNWFIQPITTLDECPPPKETDGEKSP